MVERFVPEGPSYLPNSFGPGFGPHPLLVGGSSGVKSESTLEGVISPYTPPDSRGMLSSHWSDSPFGYWLGDEEVDHMSLPSTMYDFSLLTPEMTPPHDIIQSDDVVSDVLSSLSSSHPSPTFATDHTERLPPFSPSPCDMTVTSPPPVIQTNNSSPPAPATSSVLEDMLLLSSAKKDTRPASSSKKGAGAKRKRLTEPRKQRKREQNKAAALKYRSRKKREKLNLDEEQARLEHDNAELCEQVKCAEEELAYLKSILQQVYPTTPSKRSSLCSVDDLPDLQWPANQQLSLFAI